MLVAHLDGEELAGAGSDSVGVVGAAAYEPKNGVVGIDKYQLPLFIGRGEFVVGKKVAQELRPMDHSEGLETVALVPMSQTDWEDERVCIENGGIRGQMLGVETR